MPERERREPIVFTIDDDDAMRSALARLLNSSGYEARSFARGSDFLASVTPQDAGCIVADVRMPELDGLAFQRRVVEQDILLPFIFISGYADVALSVKAMQQGAFTFLTKPFREQDLLDAVAAALALEQTEQSEREERRHDRAAYARLDERERDILAQVTRGEPNKVIAARLGYSEITIKVLRSRIMQKMGTSSVAQLARLAERLKIR